MKELKESKFNEALKSSRVIVDFGASWCGACKALDPLMEELEGKYPEVDFYTCNVEECRGLPGRYGVRSLPTLMFFKDGEVSGVIVGNVGKAKIEKAIKKLME